MVLRFDRGLGKAYVDRSWVRKGRPALMPSDAQYALSDALLRYVQEEIPGYSFLIAGHRGSGKTSLVIEAIESVADQVFPAWAQWALVRDSGEKADPPRVRQRPLLVRLHGPSLLSAELPRPEGAEPAKSAADGAPAKPAPAAQGQSALVQVAIGLYRALAQEASDAAATRVLDNDDGDAGLNSYRRELAARMRLELDRAVQPEILRAYWAEIEPAQCGLLWPRATSLARRRWLTPYTELLEITALATAAQAFEVCSGTVVYNETRKDSAAAEISHESKSGFDSKDLLSRLLGIGAGGLLGYGLFGSVLGIGLGAIGSVAITQVSKRTTKQETNKDYAFMSDRSVNTLERDLNLVIQRVRAAGLAPVFLVDELDKLPEAEKKVGEVIDRLKHLTTDNAFFCFLTGRDYYDKIESKLAAEAYPAEHTHFSERLLLGYTGAQFRDHGLRLIRIEEEAAEDEFARRLLIASAVHDSHLNTIDFVRRLRRGWAPSSDGRPLFGRPSPLVAAESAGLLAAAVQIVVDRVLADEAIIAWTGRDSGFRQMAVDAAYRISRLWQRDAGAVVMSDSEIARDLLIRRHEDDAAQADKVALLTARIGERDLQALLKIGHAVGDLLCDFRLVPPPLPDEHAHFERRVFEELGSRNITALLKPAASADPVFDFLYSRDGTDLSSARDTAGIISMLSFCFVHFIALSRVGLHLADLTPLGWPSSAGFVAAQEAMRTVAAALNAKDVKAAEAAIGPLIGFAGTINRLRPAICSAVSLAADLARTLGTETPDVSLADCVAHLLAFLPPSPGALVRTELPAVQEIPNRGEVGAVLPLPDWESRPETAENILDWLASFPENANTSQNPSLALRHWSAEISARAAPKPPVVSLEQRARDAWEQWRPPVLALLGDGPAGEPVYRFDDLVLLAAGRLPSGLLHPDVAALGDLAWTELALVAIDRQLGPEKGAETGDYAPTWALIAALKRLAFGYDSVTRLIQSFSLDQTQEWPYSIPFIPDGNYGPGKLLIISTREMLENGPTGPHLILTPEMAYKYETTLKWMFDAGIIGQIGHEEK